MSNSGQHTLDFVWRWNFNLRASAVSYQDEERVIEESYGTIVSLYSDLTSVKGDLMLVGYTSEKLKELAPDLVDQIKDGVSAGLLDVNLSGGYVLTMLALLPQENARRQLLAGRRVHEQVWGHPPRGYLASEGHWEFTLPKLLSEAGFSWAVTGDKVLTESPYVAQLPSSQPFQAALAIGIEESRIPVVFSCTDLEGQIRVLLRDAGDNDAYRQHLQRFIASLEEIQQFNKSGDLLVDVNTDSETLGLDKSRKHTLRRFMKDLAQQPFLNFTTHEEYLQRHPAQTPVYLKCGATSGGKNQLFDVWLKGSEKLDTLSTRAREEIQIARSAILIGKKLGGSVKKAERLLNNAWAALLEAQGCDARSAGSALRRDFFNSVSRPYVPGSPDRTIRAIEAALRAESIAREAQEAISLQPLAPQAASNGRI